MSSVGWKRVTRRTPCPVCGKAGWCMVARDGSAAICARMESETVVGTRGAGWLHRLIEDRSREWRHWSRSTIPVDGVRTGELTALAERFTRAVCDSMLDSFARNLGVTAWSLRRLSVGWDGEAWTFPMRDAGGRVIGIRRRFPNGRKLAVKGGREGLFIPVELPADDRLLICEGPTDTAALLDLGFAAVGRPSCRGGGGLCRRFARGRDVVVVADGDGPGQEGAGFLAAALVAYCSSVRVITPLDGVKDVREWVKRGARREDVQFLIDAATPRRLVVRAVSGRRGARGAA